MNKGDIIDEKNEEEENGAIGDNGEVVENGSGKFKIKKEQEENNEN